MCVSCALYQPMIKKMLIYISPESGVALLTNIVNMVISSYSLGNNVFI